MKKLILLFIISSLITVLIYDHCYQKNIKILSINTLNKEEDYNRYLSTYFNKSKINYQFDIDYSNNNLEIENLIAKINNDNNLKSKIHSSNVIILSIGNIDIKTENLNTIINELKELFKLLRLLNNQEIIYISPTTFKNIVYIKDICLKYNIKFINGSSFINKSELIAQIIYKNIENAWNKEKY